MTGTRTARLRPLNPASPVPLYHQLADSLSSAITQGVFRPGEKLPSEPALAQRYGVTRPTVRQAARLLAERRLIEARRGSGTFVREAALGVDLFSLAGTLESFEKCGIELSRCLLGKLEKASVPSEATFNPFAGRVAYSFRRLSRVRRRPVLLEEFSVDPAVFPELEAFNLSVKSFARVVREHYFMRPTRGRQTFQARVPDALRQRILALPPGEPVLLVRRTLDFPAAPAAVHVELFCRTDALAFSQTLEQH